MPAEGGENGMLTGVRGRMNSGGILMTGGGGRGSSRSDEDNGGGDAASSAALAAASVGRRSGDGSGRWMHGAGAVESSGEAGEKSKKDGG
uniref:Uncharacterized protein n=1 Tax=Oryza sativa subsp. japonica TaxID=39947 RepID=Q2R4Q4_ORYSJ|nr:hypothetical protein LOC_Os11g27680 [Oryza sativa Japonica Group]